MRPGMTAVATRLEGAGGPPWDLICTEAMLCFENIACFLDFAGWRADGDLEEIEGPPWRCMKLPNSCKKFRRLCNDVGFAKWPGLLQS